MLFQISPLSAIPAATETLAGWHHHEWLHLNDPAYDRKARIAEYKTYTTPYPAMFVAHHKTTPLGSARLVENDMDSHPELSQWLASLYVHQNYRQNGIGVALIQTIEKAATELNFESIYLFTEDMQTLYKKQGWEVYLTEEYYDQSITIMRKQLKK